MPTETRQPTAEARKLRMTNAIFEGDRWRSREWSEWLAVVIDIKDGRVIFEVSKDNKVYVTSRKVDYFREHYFKL